MKHTQSIATPKIGPADRHKKSRIDTKFSRKRKSSTPRISSISFKGKIIGKLSKKDVTDRQVLIKCIRAGLNVSVVQILADELRVNQKRLAQILSIPTTTFTRRMKAGTLNPEESDRVVRIARLKEIALDLMNGDEDAAVAWLHTPKAILANESPLDHAKTEVGARDVEELIGRISHGVFS